MTLLFLAAGHMGPIRGGISLGAGGVIHGLLGAATWVLASDYKNSRTLSKIYGQPTEEGSGYLLGALMVFHVAGIRLGWQRFNHLGHLGAALFGMFGASAMYKRHCLTRFRNGEGWQRAGSDGRGRGRRSMSIAICVDPASQRVGCPGAIEPPACSTWVAGCMTSCSRLTSQADFSHNQSALSYWIIWWGRFLEPHH